MDPEILKQLQALQADLKSYRDQAAEEQKNTGAVAHETKSKVAAIETQITELTGIKSQLTQLQTQVDAIDKQTQERIAPGGGSDFKSIGQQVVESAEFKRQFGEGWANRKASITVQGIHQKSVTTTTVGGYGTPGVLPVEYTGFIAPPRRRLFIRDLLTARPTTAGYIQAIKQTSFTSAASPQTEASAKSESDAAYEPYTVPVQTIAHWITATRQVLEDLPELMGWIDTDLMHFLKRKEEDEILAGSGAGQHLTGLITGATAFNSALLGSGSWNKADVLRRAIQQLEILYFEADGIVMHPTDWADLEVTKTTGASSSGEYVIGDPKSSLPPSLWSKPIVVTPAITAGTFLVGAFAIGATIRDRMDATIDVSTEHSTYFTENKVAIRCEERIALVKRHPTAFVSGSFSTSPA